MTLVTLPFMGFGEFLNILNAVQTINFAMMKKLTLLCFCMLDFF